MESITDVIECERMTLFLYDEKKEEFYSKAIIGDVNQEIILPKGEGIVGSVWQTGNSVVIQRC